MRSVTCGRASIAARDDRTLARPSDRVGSSKSITAGSPISARANASCCTIPVEHRSTRSARITDELEFVFQSSDAADCFGTRDPADARGEEEILPSGETQVKGSVLRQRDANDPTRLARAGDVTPYGHSTFGRRDRPCQATKDRRLPGAVRTAECEPLPGRELEIEAMYDLSSTEAPSETLDKE